MKVKPITVKINADNAEWIGDLVRLRVFGTTEERVVNALVERALMHMIETEFVKKALDTSQQLADQPAKAKP